MDAVKYLETLKRMKNDDAIPFNEWLDFVGKTPEHKVEYVEEWGRDHKELKDLDKDIDVLFATIMHFIDIMSARHEELEDRIYQLENEVLSDD